MRYTKTVGESLPNFSTVLFSMPVGDVSPMLYSPSIPSTGRIVINRAGEGNHRETN